MSDQIQLCNIHLITDARKEEGEWTFTGNSIPVQIPYEFVTLGGRVILPYLRDLKCIPRRESNVKCVKSERYAYEFLIVNKSGGRPLLAITQPVETVSRQIDSNGKWILPETCTSPFPIDINILKPGRKKYVNFVKLEKRRTREIKKSNEEHEISEFYGDILDMFYQTLGKMSFADIQKKIGIKEWRARAMLYDLREPSYREVASVLTYAKIDLNKLQEIYQTKGIESYV